MSKKIKNEDNREVLMITYKFDTKANKLVPYSKIKDHYKGNNYLGYENFVWIDKKWVPEMKNEIFEQKDDELQIISTWKDGGWQLQEKFIRTIDKELKQISSITYTWNAEKKIWQNYFKRVTKEAAEGWLESEIALLWNENEQKWTNEFATKLHIASKTK